MLKSVQFSGVATMLLMIVACGDDDPVTIDEGGSGAPPPSSENVQAFLRVDDDQARTGELVRVAVVIQVPSGTDTKIGSYTGRLGFDPAALELREEREINDGLRVTNPNDADQGTVRFAGASANGLENLVLYEGVFEVRQGDYAGSLQLEMEEISEALTLSDLQPNLRIAGNVYLSVDN